MRFWFERPARRSCPSRRTSGDEIRSGARRFLCRLFYRIGDHLSRLGHRLYFIDEVPGAFGTRLRTIRGRSGWGWSTARVFLWESDFTPLPPRKSGWRRRRSQPSGSGGPRQKPARVIADKGYDSDALRERLRRRGIALIAPHRSNRCRTATQEGRVLRRYQKRWIVERSIAWLGNFRRLVVRYDRSLTVYQAFVHLACLTIVLRKVLK
jgi:transposase